MTRLTTIVFTCAAVLSTGITATAQSSTPWYESASAIHRVTLKPTTQFWRFEHLAIDPVQARRQMTQWKEEGISALEIFAPEMGGNSYDGLDAIDRYRIDPSVGTMGDFRRIVRLAHSLGLHVITFQNLGYSGVTANDFRAAEDEMRAGHPRDKAAYYYWSNRVDAPPPAESNSYFFCRPDLPNYDPRKNEVWQWSDRAHAYYWSRWPGKNADGSPNHLPQYNWSSERMAR